MYVAQNIGAGVCGCWESQGLGGQGVWKTKLAIKKSKLFYMYAAHFFVGGRDPHKLIWIDTQGSLTHIVEIFKFRNVGGPRGTKWSQLNRILKIVNYLTCVQHFFCM